MGWMQAENIKFTLEQQMVFFARLVGHFNVADDINPIKIDNFDWLRMTFSEVLVLAFFVKASFKQSLWGTGSVIAPMSFFWHIAIVALY